MATAITTTIINPLSLISYLYLFLQHHCSLLATSMPLPSPLPLPLTVPPPSLRHFFERTVCVNALRWHNFMQSLLAASCFLAASLQPPNYIITHYTSYISFYIMLICVCFFFQQPGVVISCCATRHVIPKNCMQYYITAGMAMRNNNPATAS